MIIPKNLEELAGYVDSDQKVVFFFTADWCPDCQFIYPVMSDIEAAHPDMTVMIIWLWRKLGIFLVFQVLS